MKKLILFASFDQDQISIATAFIQLQPLKLKDVLYPLFALKNIFFKLKLASNTSY